MNTLTFKSFTLSGAHIFAYGSLILLQSPLHLLALTLIISGLALHAWFFIEIQLKAVVLTKLDKNNDPIKKGF